MTLELTNNQKIQILNQAIQAHQEEIKRPQGQLPALSRALAAELLKAEACQRAGLTYPSKALDTARHNLEEFTQKIQQAQQELQAFQAYAAALAAPPG